MLGILTGLVRGVGRRVPRHGFKLLESKRGNKNYYKGKGARSLGRHNSKGGYVLQEHKLPEYVVPDLKDFELKAYVSWKAPKVDTTKAGSS